MTVEEFKRQLASLVQDNRNSEAMSFTMTHLPALRQKMSGPDRMLVADWMEGVELALDLGVDLEAREAQR